MVSEDILSANSSLHFRGPLMVDVQFVVLVVIPLRCVLIDITIGLFTQAKAMDRVLAMYVDNL